MAGAQRRRSKSVSGEVFRSAVVEALDRVPSETQAAFLHAISPSSPESDLDPALWGPAPSPAAAKEAALADLAEQFTGRRETFERSLTVADVAGLLGVSDQAVRDRITAGDLVALRPGKQWRLPAWQFNPDTPRGFVPGLRRLQEVFPGGVVTLSRWVAAPSPDLDNQTPADRLVSGDVEAVVGLAETLTAASW